MADMLAGKRILIVEDEYFIAADMRRMLRHEGAEVVGPVGTLAVGLSLAREPLDAAILDVNLEKALSYPIAERLRERHVPYLFLTGYDPWSMPSEHRGTPRLAKPFSSHAVLAMVEALVAGRVQAE